MWPFPGISHQSAETRRRPHVMQWVANITSRLRASEQEAENFLQVFQAQFSLTGAAQLSRLERQVILTLCFRTTENVRKEILTYLGAVSFQRSPWTTEALAAPALVLGHVPKSAGRCTSWRDQLKSTEDSLDLLMTRWIAGWENMPEGMRKKRNAAEVGEEAARCALFEHIMMQWRQAT